MRNGKLPAKLLLVFMLVVLLGAAVNYRSRPPSLLDRARRVVSVTDWTLEPGFTYFWLTNEEVLFYHNSGDVGWTGVDFTNGEKVRLDALTKVFNASGAKHTQVSLSPTGDWMLWTDAGGGNLFGAALDGTGHFKSAQGGWYSEIHWMADGRHWLEMVTDASGARFIRALVHGVSPPRITHSMVIQPKTLLEHGCAMAVDEDNILIDSSRNRHAEDVVLTSLSGRFPPRKYTVTLPDGAEIDEAEFSPNGERVAWKVFYQRTQQAPFLLRFLPGMHMKPVRMEAIFVSNLDGAGMREMGSMEAPAHPHEKSSVFGNIHWLPDNKQISFIYRNTLYNVPVD